MKREDDEDYHFQVLRQLANEADKNKEILEQICEQIDGFTVDQYELDSQHYRMKRILADQIQQATADIRQN